MIPKINGRTRYSNSVKKHLRKIKPWQAGAWDKQNNNIKLLKSQLRDQLLVLQNSKCAYCGLDFNETSSSELEHIAPKGGPKIPKYLEFTFTPLNLVLACHLCNSPIKKGTFDPIIHYSRNYKECTFKIYHPFFDNPDVHFNYVFSGFGMIVQNKTIKGKDTIDLFDLNSAAHINARGRNKLLDILKAALEETQAEEILTSTFLTSEQIADILKSTTYKKTL